MSHDYGYGKLGYAGSHDDLDRDWRLWRGADYHDPYVSHFMLCDQMWQSIDLDEVSGYVWLKTLKPNTKVFAYSSDDEVIGFDMFSCIWCDNVNEFRENLLYRNSTEVYSWLKMNGYEYFIIDGKSFKVMSKKYGENITNELLPKRFGELSSFGGFKVVHQTQGMAVFEFV